MAAEIDHIPSIEITVKRESMVNDMFAIYKQLFSDEAVTKDQISFEELCGMSCFAFENLKAWMMVRENFHI